MNELKPVPEELSDYEGIEKAISEVLKREIYLPLLSELGLKKSAIIRNSSDHLLESIRTGRIAFSHGVFSGRFDSSVSRELRKLGATWKNGTYRIHSSDLPIEVRNAISISISKFDQVVAKIDERIRRLVPAEIADKVQLSKLFDASLWKVDKKLKSTFKDITVSPNLTPERSRQISEEYTKDMQRYIKDWTEKEIVELRKQVQERAQKGRRYDELAKVIKASYGVSQNKAKFLARQETSLFMTKFKETRYRDAGIEKYKWRRVAGSAAHPVRPMHKALDGKIFSWDSPPVTSPTGDRNNPGQDYNCRCVAVPIVNFNK